MSEAKVGEEPTMVGSELAACAAMIAAAKKVA
jgi:hypothetical protein